MNVTQNTPSENHILQIPHEFVVHEEVELGVIIKQKCKNVPESQSLQYVGGYCLALDLTEVRLMVGIIF
jgi:acylpyruvate hydrolase